ncbi:MAG: hypothetical protein ACRDMH_12680 [Solirubrobacterales bacterium]
MTQTPEEMRAQARTLEVDDSRRHRALALLNEAERKTKEVKRALAKAEAVLAEPHATYGTDNSVPLLVIR